jgi:pentatricopeptide repeat protein
MTAAHAAPQGLTHRERKFGNWIQKLQRGFQPEDVVEVLKQQRDVDLCFDIFRWASQQRRYKHNHLTYHVMIQKFASATRLNKVEILVNEILAGACDGSEALFNTLIYIYIEACKLEKAINVYRHMRKTSDCKPSLRTYNILLSALVDKCTNSYVSHLYMRNIRALFKQMVAANVAPDIFTLNTMIKGYSKSLRLNYALRIFHQMELYCCTPNAHTFNYLIRGLCLQSRTDNAIHIYQDMIGRGFVPSNMVYNSLVNSLSFCGELQRATKVLREMIEKGGVPDFVTYKTLVDGLCKEGKREQARQLLHEFRQKDIALDGFSDRKLLDHLQLWSETVDAKNLKISRDT